MNEAAAKGRSLWVDAWMRLKANRAAVVSAIYLVLMTLACIIGPSLTGHEFTTIYGDYVRTPPSLSPYPKEDMIKTAIDEVAKRARLNVADWKLEGDRAFMTITSAKPIDERNTRYIDRSDTFEDARVEETSADKLKMVISAKVQQ